VLCGDICKDTSTDVNNCGGCGTACPASTPCQTATCVAGHCQVTYTAAGTACGSPTCSSGMLYTPICDGSGTCGTVTSSCAPYVCNGVSGCYTSCTGNSQCASGYVCTGGQCVAAPSG
jgi:hypothetical protein